MNLLSVDRCYLLSVLKSMCFIFGYLLPVSNSILMVITVLYCVGAYLGLRESYHNLRRLPTILILTENLLIGYILNQNQITDLLRYIILYVCVAVFIECMVQFTRNKSANIVQYTILIMSCISLLALLFSICHSYVITIIWACTVLIHSTTSKQHKNWRNYDVCQIFVCLVLDKFVSTKTSDF